MNINLIKTIKPKPALLSFFKVQLAQGEIPKLSSHSLISLHSTSPSPKNPDSHLQSNPELPSMNPTVLKHWEFSTQVLVPK